MKGQRPGEMAGVLASLTQLMRSWSSPSIQASFAAAADLDIDPIDIPPLYVLGLNGSMRASDLAAALHVTRPTMSKQLSRLTNAALIERGEDLTDRRAAVIHLSPTGAAAYERLATRGVEALQRTTSQWSADETAQFAAQLARFVADLSTHVPSPDTIGRKPAADHQ